MKLKPLISTLSIPVIIVALSACGSEQKGLNTNPRDASKFTDASAPTVKTGFGKPLNLGKEITVTFNENVAFTPGPFASNYQKGQVPNKLDIKVTNNGSKSLDLSSIAIAANSGSNTCVDVLDGDNNINGAPTESIPAKQSVTFSFGVACIARVGDPLNLSVSLGGEIVAVEGTLK